MIKIKYNDSGVFEEVSFSRTSVHVLTLIGATVNTSGFCTYRMNETKLGDFSDYTTVYRVLPDGCQYSNDGSVWHEPDPEPPMPGTEQAPTLVVDEIGNTYRQEIGADGKIHLILIGSYTGELFE